jgi:hypothetical protein
MTFSADESRLTSPVRADSGQLPVRFEPADPLLPLEAVS